MAAAPPPRVQLHAGDVLRLVRAYLREAGQEAAAAAVAPPPTLHAHVAAGRWDAAEAALKAIPGMSRVSVILTAEAKPGLGKPARTAGLS
jgi:hypothetical protein